MTPVYQRQVIHDPSLGLFGDCFRACLVSLLDVPYETVPDFMRASFLGELEDWRPAVNEWLNQRGMFMLQVMAPEFSYLEQVGASDAWHLISAPSVSNPAVYHCVVGRGGVVVHDPCPSSLGIVSDKSSWMYEFILPRDPTWRQRSITR